MSSSPTTPNADDEEELSRGVLGTRGGREVDARTIQRQLADIEAQMAKMGTQIADIRRQLNNNKEDIDDDDEVVVVRRRPSSSSSSSSVVVVVVVEAADWVKADDRR